MYIMGFFFFFQAEDGIRDGTVTGVQTCALPISLGRIARAEDQAEARHLSHCCEPYHCRRCATSDWPCTRAPSQSRLPSSMVQGRQIPSRYVSFDRSLTLRVYWNQKDYYRSGIAATFRPAAKEFD